MPEQKVKKRLNAIDYIIIIVALGCIAGVFFRFDVVDRLGSSKSSQGAEISFRAEGLDKETAEAIGEGEVFRVVSEDMVFGTVTERSESTASVQYTLDSDGRIISEEQGGKYTASGVISASGSFTENGFFLGGTLYTAAGKTVKIHSKSAEISVIITKIEASDT